MPRQAVRCKGIDEAGCETAEAAVAEACIRLLVERVRKGQVKVTESFLDDLIDAEVHEVALEQAAHEELDGEIVGLLLLTLRISFVRLDPVIRDEGLRYSSDRLINLVRGQLVDLTAPHDVCSLDETGLHSLLGFLELAALLLIFLFLCQIEHSSGVHKK